MVSRAGKKETGKSKTKPVAKKGVGRTRREKQAEKLTHIALEKYRILFESFPLGITITDAEGNIVEANRESERLLGIKRSEQLQRRYDGPEWKIIRPDGTPMPPDEYASVRALKENRRIENVEMGIVKNGGNITWINVTAEPIPLENFGVAITYSDISARRKLEDDFEKQRREFKHIIDSAPIIIFYKDVSGRMVRVNKTFSEALKLAEAEILGKTVFDVYSTPIAQAMTDDDQEVLRTGRPKLNIEEPYESATGIRWVRTDKVPIIDDNGRPIGLVGFAQDITERKLAEKALMESEERFRTSAQNMMDAFGIYTAIRNQSGQITDFKIEFVNTAACLANGMSKEDQLGKRLCELLPSHLETGLFDQYCRVVETGEPLNIESQIYEDVYGEKRIARVFDINAVKLGDGFAASWRDVTARTRMEEALRESETHVRTKLDAILAPQGDIGKLELADILDIDAIQSIMDDFNRLTNISAWILDLKGKILISTGWRDICTLFHRANPETCKNCVKSDTQLSEGVAPGTFKIYKCKNNMWDLVTPIVVGDKHIGNLFLGQFLFDDEAVDDAMFRSQAKRYGFNEEEYLTALERVPRLSRETVDTAMAFYSKFAHMISSLSYSNIALARSLTEKNNLLSALQASEEQYRNLFDNAIEAIFVAQEGKTVFLNPQTSRMIGYSAEEIRDKPFIEFIHVDDRELVIDRHVRRLKGDSIPDQYSFRIIHKNGDLKWVELNTVVITWQGKPATLNFLQDITERKMAEKAKQESEAQYHLLAEHTTDFVWLMDMDLKPTYQSPSAERLTGFTPEELVTLPIEKRVTPESLKLAAEVFLKEMPLAAADPEYNPILTLELEVYRKDGSTLWSENKFSIIRNENGNPISILGEARDITNRKLAEKALHVSGEKYRSLVETSGAGIASSDLEGKITFANATICLWAGLDEAAILGQPFKNFVHPDDMASLANILSSAVQGESISTDVEFRIIHKDGKVTWLYTNPTPIILDGKPVGFNFILQNVTRRKQAEESLRQSETRYRSVLEQIEEAYYEVDLDGNLTFFNDAMCSQLGYSAEELMGMSYQVYTSKDDMQRVYDIFDQVYRTGNPNTGFSISGIRKDGAQISIENSALPLRNDDGKIIGFRGVARDVTKRLLVENALRESEAQYRLLSEHTTDAVGLMDKNLKVIYVSPSSEKLRGFTVQEIKDMPLDKQVTEESFKLATEVMLRELPRVEAEPDYNPMLSLELEYIRKDGTTVWLENKLSIIRDDNGNLASILAESRDITERREAEKKLAQTLAALEKTLADTVIAISRIVEMKDPFTAGHQMRVAQLANAMAKKMNLTDEEAAILNTAATIHDIGKIYVPSDILSKPGKLNPLEYEIIQTHVRGSYEILKDINFTGPIAQIVYQHHERMDGSGYPLGLKAPKILPQAKILIVADVVEAMSSHRPYRAAMGINKALEEITNNRGKLYDETSVDACLELFRNNEFEFKS